ncbi:3-phosphoshikimate 1-carboxyvinyltransferase [Aerococcus sanguinicola]|uniref:3-phosphoshikimate 1-carboxyvinyltransferase n=1 Tax=unclassified Aerococcus TaxID=2618060 RepID=UPI0008A5E732|nr:MULTISPECIES: 3-phosphoshikimate 1-carboxyvinyltransferase [unclassified Aerococcus]MDK6232661.1 3-phosphoshikimate 1-carboxyvinyltransferase [Aerococcus sp. UMB10185]MDK6855049.1 3-phosphoshikimate 1-carboxyvinyltransferase [Aerococcus sp. UMB7533]MDK8501684.1 3-phosphoshikimate 1-carboxyvinyltransferase [Aerococcus sp. UMB1112A]OFN02516.1 3-phosphoshikimate 1-carboxyvinyltransferase [Aerococcus sp. HMSC062A02]OHO45689.1 3-phosphoshikimate 1-carboxyvinyltransferase [Aerococcus sp. HMSC035B
MTDLQIQAKPLAGAVHIPPSKSLAHRAIIAAGLAQGESQVTNVQLSDDIQATIEAMQSLGAEIKLTEAGDQRVDLSICGGNPSKSASRLIDANESGSTLRFMIPIASLFPGQTHFVGRGKLGSRPLDPYEKIYNEQGLFYENLSDGALDLRVEGKLQAGAYQLAGNISSQFITGLLYTLPLLEGDSTLQITGPLESVGYIHLTLDILERYGIEIDYQAEDQCFQIKGNQAYQAADYQVEGDYSQAAFFLCAGALGNDVWVKGLAQSSQQGDQEIIPFLKKLGARVKNQDGGIQILAQGLEGDCELDGSQCPDVIPVLALTACLAKGETQIKNLARLRIKESDRLAATQEELSKLGANIQVLGDSLVIQGVDQLQGACRVSSHKDHRIAMMLAIASTVCQEAIIIEDADSVSKSYPYFWEDFASLGGEYSERNLG